MRLGKLVADTHGLLPRDPAERQIAGVDRDGSTAERERLQRHGAMLGASRIVKRYLSGWKGDQIIGKALHKGSVSKVASGQGMGLIAFEGVGGV